MSIIIKNMKMPKSCFGCHLFKNDECILIDYEDKDMLAKCASAPTIVHLYMVPKLLLPIIDKKIWEESE